MKNRSFEKMLVAGDFNDHVGSDLGGFGEVHRRFGTGQINDGGIRLLAGQFVKLVTRLNTSETETMID